MKKILLFLILLSTNCWSADKLEVLITPEKIHEKIKEIAVQIDKEFQNEELTIVMVMKGAICVSADLIRQLNTTTFLEYIKASSYGNNGANRGELKVIGLDKLDLESKNVLLVDDIFDSGTTMTSLVAQLKLKNPKKLKTLVLLMKKIPRETKYRPDYVLFDIDDHFVVGYGLDYKELYRGLPGIFAIVKK